MRIDIKKFKRIKKEAIELYKSANNIHCPYFGEDISFNSKGLEHLEFKARGRARSIHDQFFRFKLLKFAVQIIKKSHTLQEFQEAKKLEAVKTNTRREEKMVLVRYYGFVAILDDYRMKVIIKEVVGGAKHFWSVIPFWKKGKRDNKKILHLGDLECD